MVKAARGQWPGERLGMSYWETVSTLSSARNVPGVYVLFSGKKVMYVGQSLRICTRFVSHEWEYGFGGSLFTRWGQISDPVIKVKYTRRLGDWLMWEYRLITRLRPRFNIKHLPK